MRLKRTDLPTEEQRLAWMAVPALLAFMIAATVASGLASLALPYVWFWLAVIDSRYQIGRPRGGAAETAAPAYVPSGPEISPSYA